MPTPKKSHGTESSKNTPSLPRTLDSPPSHSDGHQMDIQEIKDHTTAVLEETLLLEELLLMLITNAASMLVSKFLEPMLKLCQDNGNIKLAHALVSRSVITCRSPDISSTDALKSSVFPFLLSQSSSQTGTDLDATPTSLPRP